MTTLTGINGVVSESATWTDVVKRRPNHRKDLSARDAFQETVVAAVYIDQSVKRQRERSIIMRGLAPKVSTPDKELFTSCVKGRNFN
jgi:hypothetical protein